MNQILKPQTSRIITQNIIYGNSSLLKILIEEQNFICAYTQVRITSAFTVDTEHFNPTLKNTLDDTYNNWFAVSTKWNRNKGSIPKWNKFQPIIHPTDETLEERILYNNGVYEFNDEDVHAKNLVLYLNLNQEQLVNQRIKYMAHLKFLLNTAFHNNLDELKIICRKKTKI